MWFYRLWLVSLKVKLWKITAGTCWLLLHQGCLSAFPFYFVLVSFLFFKCGSKVVQPAADPATKPVYSESRDCRWCYFKKKGCLFDVNITCSWGNDSGKCKKEITELPFAHNTAFKWISGCSVSTQGHNSLTDISECAGEVALGPHFQDKVQPWFTLTTDYSVLPLSNKPHWSQWVTACMVMKSVCSYVESLLLYFSFLVAISV